MQQKQPYLSIVRNLAKKEGDNKPDLKGFITLHESLPAGDYEVPLYGGMSKQGNRKYSGIIKPKQEKVVAHWQEMR